MTRLLLLLALLPSAAWGQEHRHAGKVVPGDVGRFYGGWMMPDDRTKSCCNQLDCSEADARMENGRWRVFSRVQGKWVDVPASKIERERSDIPPGSHLCENSSGILCFGAGGGT